MPRWCNDHACWIGREGHMPLLGGVAQRIQDDAGCTRARGAEIDSRSCSGIREVKNDGRIAGLPAIRSTPRRARARHVPAEGDAATTSASRVESRRQSRLAIFEASSSKAPGCDIEGTSRAGGAQRGMQGIGVNAADFAARRLRESVGHVRVYATGTGA